MFHGILRKKTDARVCSYKKEAYVSVPQFPAAPNENYVPEMRAYSLSKSARLK